MRRKVSTLIDDALLKRAKVEALRQEKQISEIFGEALQSYLGEAASHRSGSTVASETWGILPVSRATLRRALEDDWLLHQ